MTQLQYEQREGTYGAKLGFYAPLLLDDATGVWSFGEVKPFTGLRAVSIETSQEAKPFYADDTVHLSVAGQKTITGSITLYQLPRDFLINHMGYKEDTNGALLDTGAYKSFAFGYVETITDAVGETTRELRTYYNCQAGPASAAAATTADSVELKEISVPLTISPSQIVRDSDLKPVSEIVLRETAKNKAAFETALQSIYRPDSQVGKAMVMNTNEKKTTK